MKGIFYFACSVIMVIVLASCGSTKKIQKVITTPPHIDTVQAPPVVSDDPKADSMKFIRSVFAKIQTNRIDFKTFSATIKVHYQASDGKNNDFTAHLLMLKDS